MHTSKPFTRSRGEAGRRPNRLIAEKSPYLLQHAYNPVDWYAWGEEAFEQAAREDKPIFLSIGYSTCYWCHVMEREVFENEEIAALMNTYFVNIKVDREERPDIDRVYMKALQAMSGSGGWPMSMFLTPDLRPFFGATYIPSRTQHGRLGFGELAERIHELWRSRRLDLVASAEHVVRYLQERHSTLASDDPAEEVLRMGFQQIQEQYDPVNGGFGGAPKFPRPVVLNFLLRYYVRTRENTPLEMCTTTLRKMADGGIYDHIGGGFHRYSVDARWHVPHFEKMLYDQAQLVVAYLEAFQLTGDNVFADVARDVMGYVEREMMHPEGAFYSAEDAESAVDPADLHTKSEGAFYLWSKDECDRLFGLPESNIVAYYYGIQDNGNVIDDPHGVFGGKNVLHVAHSIREVAEQFDIGEEEVREIIARARRMMFEERAKRPRPHLDDKVLVSWNGLMISACARAAQVFDEARYAEAAERAARFIESKMYDRSTGRLLHRYRDGEARFGAHLDGYAFFVQALIDLYETAFDTHWLEFAIRLTERQIAVFYDSDNGGFWDTAGDDASVLVRTKEEYDGAEPAGNSIAAMNLLKLAMITGRDEWREMALRTFRLFGKRLQELPYAMPQMLAAIDFFLGNPVQILLSGDPDDSGTRALAREVWASFFPNKVLLLLDGGKKQEELLSFNQSLNLVPRKEGKATACVCEDGACRLPVNSPAAFSELLSTLARERVR